MKLEQGDIVQTGLYGPLVLFKIVCFFDRGNELACSAHQSVMGRPGSDDVHAELIWKKRVTVAPAWPVGKEITFAYAKLRSPSNELMVIALSVSKTPDGEELLRM